VVTMFDGDVFMVAEKEDIRELVWNDRKRNVYKCGRKNR
jgi:hypothetical protein